VLNEMIISVI